LSHILICYIRYMPNLSKNALATARLRFIEDVANLLTPWGAPPVAARLYGYLLLCGPPVSLDQITAELGVSKSTASVAARLLESYTLARRCHEPGTKRALYAAADNYEGMIGQQNRLLDALAEQLNTGSEIADSAEVRARLKEMADFYRLMRSAMADALSRWKRGKRPSNR
jgi:DNA-binding transcriptional regulator GbsR (MarR family)